MDHFYTLHMSCGEKIDIRDDRDLARIRTTMTNAPWTNFESAEEDHHKVMVATGHVVAIEAKLPTTH